MMKVGVSVSELCVHMRISHLKVKKNLTSIYHMKLMRLNPFVVNIYVMRLRHITNISWCYRRNKWRSITIHCGEYTTIHHNRLLYFSTLDCYILVFTKTCPYKRLHKHTTHTYSTNCHQVRRYSKISQNLATKAKRRYANSCANIAKFSYTSQATICKLMC